MRLALFSALFALALLLLQAWWDGFELLSLHGLVVLAALAVLVRPASVARLGVLLGLEVVAVASDMPGAGSHTVLAAVVAATLLGFGAWRAVRERRMPVGEELFARAAPFLRGAVVTLYAFAALAKLNPGYFDAAVSCGAAMAPRILWFAPGLLAGQAWLGTAAILGSVAVELALPVLLLIWRTRAAGLVLGVGFHLVLALSGNVPFSSLLLALYVAFLPPGALGRPAWQVPRWGEPVAFAALLGAWVVAGALAEAAGPGGAREAIGWGTRLVVIAVVGAGAALVLRRGPRAPSPARPGPRTHPILLAGLAVLVLNGVSPYVGLKTESSFAMFSNLQTEGEDWNHALVPEAVRVFGLQEELVRVVASNDPSLLRRTRAGTRMVRFELDRYLRAHPGAWARTEPGGGRRSVATVAFPLSGLVDRVAKFRDVRAAERRGC